MADLTNIIQTTRFFINTTETAEDVSGYCWWEASGYGLCDPHLPPKPVTSCPYIGWQRTVIVGQEDISWETETPGHVGIGKSSRHVGSIHGLPTRMLYRRRDYH